MTRSRPTGPDSVLRSDGTCDPMSDPFVDWLRAASADLYIDLDYLLATDGPALEWFRDVFCDAGPVSVSRLRLLSEEATERSARDALGIMRREASFFHKRMPDRGIEERDSMEVPGKRGFYFLGRESHAWTLQSAIIEIGEAVQDEIMERDQEAWPVCELHGSGLHLKRLQEKVVWWCRPGSHAYRVIYSPS